MKIDIKAPGERVHKNLFYILCALGAVAWLFAPPTASDGFIDKHASTVDQLKLALVDIHKRRQQAIAADLPIPEPDFSGFPWDAENYDVAFEKYYFNPSKRESVRYLRVKHHEYGWLSWWPPVTLNGSLAENGEIFCGWYVDDDYCLIYGVFTFLGILWLMFMIMMLPGFFLARQTNHWPLVDAEILKTELMDIQYRDSDGDLVHGFRPQVSYRYRVDGQWYQSTCLSLVTEGTYSQKRAQSIIDRYEQGSIVEVAVHPEDASVVCLWKGVPASLWFALGFATFVPGVLAGTLVLAWVFDGR